MQYYLSLARRVVGDFCDFTALAVHRCVYSLRWPQVCLRLIPSFTLAVVRGKFSISLLGIKSPSALCSGRQNVNFAFSHST